MTFGLLLLLLASLGTYFYYTHVQARQNSAELAAGQAREHLAAKAARVQAQVRSERPETLSYAEPGALVKMKDVGLSLLSFDGQVRVKHLFKQGLRRWYSLEIDSGTKLYTATTQARDESCVYLSLECLSAADLALSPTSFYDVSAPAPAVLRWVGSDYHLFSQESAVFCHNGNELEQEPCLIWHYRDSTTVLALTLIRWQDGSLAIAAQVKVAATQIEILAAAVS